MLLESCISQVSSDITFSLWNLVGHPSYHKQPDGPLEAPEITRWATLTLTVYGWYKYIMYTVGQLYITAFQWYKILHRKLSGPLIISQTAGWSIWCTGDHQMGRFDWYTDVTNIYDLWLKSCISQLSSDIRGSLIGHSSYHKQPDGPFHAPRITGQANRQPTYQIL